MPRCCASTVRPPARITSSSQLAGHDLGHLHTLELELESLKLSQIRHRAQALGVEEQQIDEAVDGENPKASLVALVLAAAERLAEADRPATPSALRAELALLKRSALMRRAEEVHVSAEALLAVEDCEDTVAAKAALIDLICERRSSSTGEQFSSSAGISADGGRRSALKHELSRMKLKALKGRARELGVDEQQLEDVDDADDIRGAVIALIVAASESPSYHQRFADTNTDDADRLASDLQGLHLKALRQRAKDIGITRDALDAAMDTDEPALEVINLILSSQIGQGAKELDAHMLQAADPKAIETRRAEMTQMSLLELRRQAKVAGLGSDVLEDALDSSDPKATMIKILLEHEPKHSDARDELSAELQSLQAMRLTELRQRAKELGVDDEMLEETLEAADPKAAVISLVVEKIGTASSPSASTTPAMETRRLEMTQMSLLELRRQAKVAGLGSDVLEDALDSSD
eukprot:SAG31_NODE_6654_length_1935_cov_2.828976_1_plen_464_part_01